MKLREMKSTCYVYKCKYILNVIKQKIEKRIVKILYIIDVLILIHCIITIFQIFCVIKTFLFSFTATFPEQPIRIKCWWCIIWWKCNIFEMYNNGRMERCAVYIYISLTGKIDHHQQLIWNSEVIKANFSTFLGIDIYLKTLCLKINRYD